MRLTCVIGVLQVQANQRRAVSYRRRDLSSHAQFLIDSAPQSESSKRRDAGGVQQPRQYIPFKSRLIRQIDRFENQYPPCPQTIRKVLEKALATEHRGRPVRVSRS